MDDLLSNARGFPHNAISPFTEMAAYEALWSDDGATFKRLADRFREQPTALPSDLVPVEKTDAVKRWLLSDVFPRLSGAPGIRIKRTGDYPEKLLAAAHPLEVLYYIGNWELAFLPSVAVVGSRKVSQEGIKRCQQLVRELVARNYTVVSGLATGVDTVAHTTCIENCGRTIGVLGTPLTEVYPAKNKALQDMIAKHHLLVSQVPFKRYCQQDYRANRSFFPERNITMSALTDATVIVEASETSGTLYQARAALRQGRKLFILSSCFDDTSITWPSRFEQKGAIRVRSFHDIDKHLPVSEST